MAKIKNMLTSGLFFSIVHLSQLVLLVEKRKVITKSFPRLNMIGGGVSEVQSGFVFISLLLLMTTIYFIFSYYVYKLLVTEDQTELFASCVLSFSFSHFLLVFTPLLTIGSPLMVYALVNGVAIFYQKQKTLDVRCC